GTYGPGAGSRRSEQAMANVLTAVIADSRHVVTTLDAVGAPDVSNGRALAAGTVATFDQIGQSDAEWRSELRTRDWAWATMSRVKRERLRISIQELLLVGRQFERLPLTQERQNAMASSPVCREVFGSVRVGGQQSNRSGLAELYRKRHPRAESLNAGAGGQPRVRPRSPPPAFVFSAGDNRILNASSAFVQPRVRVHCGC